MKKILVCLLALIVLCCSAALADDCEHVYDIQSEVVPATCTVHGYYTLTCSKCNAASYELEVEKALGHTFGEAVTNFTGEDGKTYQKATCVRCGTEVIEQVEQAIEFTCDHNKVDLTKVTGSTVAELNASAAAKGLIVNWDTVPTCTQSGSAHLRCGTCKRELGTKNVPATKHSYTVVLDQKQPTCVSDGWQKVTCGKADCDKLGEVTKVIVPDAFKKLGHNFDPATAAKVIVNDATCTHQGQVQIKCSRCDEWSLETTPALNHNDWKDIKWTVKTPATCEKDGVKTRHCPICGYDEEASLKALGHDIEMDYAAPGQPSWQAPTCAKEGYFYRTCKREGCNFHYIFDFTRVPATGDHKVDPSKTKIVIPATCYSDGVKEQYCSCELAMGTVLYREKHTLDAGKVLEAPKCYATGKTEYKCTVEKCDYVSVVVTPATNLHKFEQVAVAPTCLEHGYLVTKCTNEGCTKVITKAVDPAHPAAKGHTWYTQKVSQPITCTTGAVATQICTTCKATQEIELQPSNHLSDGKKVLIPATCTTAAAYAEHCKVCKAALNVVELDGETALGHDFGTEPVKPATCTAAGSTSECVRCGFTVARPATGHKYVSSVHNNNCGGTYVSYNCVACGKHYSVGGTDSYVTAKFSLAPDTEVTVVVTEDDKEYVVYTVDDKTVYIPTIAFAEDVIANADELVLEVVKINGVASLQCRVVTNGKTTDVCELLNKLGMICE